MTTIYRLDYIIQPVGVSPAKLAAKVAAIPPPIGILTALGVRLASDQTLIGPPITRRLRVALEPDSIAVMLATIPPGSPSIRDIQLTDKGSNYVAAPILSFTPNPGDPPPLQPAQAQAMLEVSGATVYSGGSGYTAPVVQFVSPNPPVHDAVAANVARGHATIGAGGVITGIVIDYSGANYRAAPLIVIRDATGIGAIAMAQMRVGSATLSTGGLGYSSPPTINATPLFDHFFPPGTNQAAPFRGLMRRALEQALSMPVTTVEPYIPS